MLQPFFFFACFYKTMYDRVYDLDDPSFFMYFISDVFFSFVFTAENAHK